MPENSADVSESAVFTHVGSQGYMVNANMSEIEATSGLARKLQQRREQPDDLLAELLVPWPGHPVLQGHLV